MVRRRPTRLTDIQLKGQSRSVASVATTENTETALSSEANFWGVSPSAQTRASKGQGGHIA